MVKVILTAALFTAIFLAVITARANAQDANGNSVTVIGSRPQGCPRAYCGCGLRLFLGLNDTRLNKASMWARIFPRVGPQPGAVAVRSHHVFLLVAHIAGDTYLVRDYNSGGGLSRIHHRSVRGYVFVKPGVSNENNLAAGSRDGFNVAHASGKRTRGAEGAGRWRTAVQMGAVANSGAAYGAIQ